MSVWLIILLGGGLTFSLRLSFIFLLERVSVPAWLKRGLRFVPAAVLSAIILPQLSAPNGPLDLSWRNAQLVSGALAVLVAWRTKNVLMTLAVGMVALLILQSVLRLG